MPTWSLTPPPSPIRSAPPRALIRYGSTGSSPTPPPAQPANVRVAFSPADRHRGFSKHPSGPEIASRMIDPHSLFLLASTVIAVLVLIALIAIAKLNAFLTLILVSLSLAMVAGLPLATAIHSFETGMGNTLGHIAIVVALGTMLGKMMAESGGAD